MVLNFFSYFKAFNFKWFKGRLNKIEAATGAVLYKKVFLKFSQISQKKHMCWSLF